MGIVDDISKVASPISAGLGAAASIYGSYQNRKAVQETNAANAKLQQQQLDWNEKMWNKNNEYNSPQAQMQRLKDAGLNPDLMYGQGTTGNASAPAQGVDPSYNQVEPVVNPFEGLSQGLEKAMNAQSLQLQIDNQKLQNEYLSKQVGSYDSVIQASLENMRSSTNLNNSAAQKNIADISVSEKEALKLATENDLLKQQFDWNNETYNIRLNTLYEQYKTTKAERKKAEQEVENAKQMLVVLKAQAYMYQTAGQLNEENIETITALKPYQIEQAKQMAAKLGIEVKQGQIQVNEAKFRQMIEMHKRGRNEDGTPLSGFMASVNRLIYDNVWEGIKSVTDLIPLLPFVR